MRKLTPERLADIKADIEDRRSVEYVLGDDVDELADIIHDLDLADQEIAKLKATLEYWKDGTFRCHGCDGTHEMDCPVNDGKQQREVDKLREEVGRLGKVVEAARGMDCLDPEYEPDNRLLQALKDYDDA